MSDKLKKYLLEAASETSEAAFVLCTRKPFFRAKIHRFNSPKEFANFHSENPKVQVHTLPIWLEVIEIEQVYIQKHFERSLKQMAHWYYFTQIKNDTI